MSPEAQKPQSVPNEHSSAALRGISRLIHWRKRASGLHPEIRENNLLNETYGYVQGLLTDESLAEHEREILSLLQTTPELAAVHETAEGLRQLDKDWAAAHNAGAKNEVHALQEKLPLLQAAFQKFSPDVRAMEEDLTYQLSEQRRLGSYVVNKNEPVAQRLLDLLSRAPKIQETPTEKAPFADWQDNASADKHVPSDEQVREYLKSRLFITRNDINKVDHGKRRIVINTDRDNLFEIPLELVTSADSFSSWLGRESGDGTVDIPSKFGGGHGTSLDKIKLFARAASELPPVGVMQAFVQPNGKVFFSNVEGHSHRIAAAMLRGDTMLKAQTLIIKPITRNIIE